MEVSLLDAWSSLKRPIVDQAPAMIALTDRTRQTTASSDDAHPIELYRYTSINLNIWRGVNSCVSYLISAYEITPPIRLSFPFTNFKLKFPSFFWFYLESTLGWKYRNINKWKGWENCDICGKIIDGLGRRIWLSGSFQCLLDLARLLKLGIR